MCVDCVFGHNVEGRAAAPGKKEDRAQRRRASSYRSNKFLKTRGIGEAGGGLWRLCSPVHLLTTVFDGDGDGVDGAVEQASGFFEGIKEGERFDGGQEEGHEQSVPRPG